MLVLSESGKAKVLKRKAEDVIDGRITSCISYVPLVPHTLTGAAN